MTMRIASRKKRPKEKVSPNTLIFSMAISAAPLVAGEHFQPFDLSLNFDSHGGGHGAVSSQSECGHIAVHQLLSLDSIQYEVLKPIVVVVDQIDEHDFLATFEDAQVTASGETEEQSLVMLKDMLIGQLEHLERIPAASLGRQPTKQLSLLRAHIKKRA